MRNYKVGMQAPAPIKIQSEDDVTRHWCSSYQAPIISITCHTYNHENYISDALDSFLMQVTRYPFEIIVHDDASQDGTQAIIESYKKRFPRIVKPIYQKENQYSRGVRPVKHSFEAAKGSFIAFCEGDDYWLDNKKLQKQCSFLLENEEYSVCGHDALVIKEGKIVSLNKLPPNLRRDIPSHELKKGKLILTLTAMFRKGFEFHPPELCHIKNGDKFLFSRLGLIGSYKFMGDIVPGVYREHGGGVWSSASIKEKAIMSATTSYWIMQYYSRIEQPTLARYYAVDAVDRILSQCDNLSLVTLLKLVLVSVKRYLFLCFPKARKYLQYKILRYK